MAKETPAERFGTSRMLTQEDIRRFKKKESAKPQTADFLHEFKHAVKFSKDGKKYRARLSGRDRAKFREMQRPLLRHMQEDGQRANAQERKRMFVNPVNGKKSYVFDSMVEGIERKTGMRVRRSHGHASERTVYKKEAPGLHEYVYRRVRNEFVLVRHDVFKHDVKSNTMKLVRSWKRGGKR